MCEERIKLMHNYCKQQADSSVSEVSSSNNTHARLSRDKLKFLIENCTEPLVFKNILKWKILKWDLADWCSVLENEELPCRCGKNTFSKDPQWETTTLKKTLTINNFVELKNTENPKEWIYFDYKYLKDWLINKEKVRKEITWKTFGYPEVGCQESTIWIGTEGAHTPCHIDTYGCNLVAQVLGRKLWCLFPPTENLQPTRIPYEESTIFSRLNFFSPQISKFKDIQNCRIVILNPGEVLFVPHGWWHYVENLELAISINTWLPTIQDEEKRLEEAVVKMIAMQFLNGLSGEERKLVLIQNNVENPSSMQDMKYNLNVTHFCLKSYQNFLQNSEKSNGEHSKGENSKNSVEEILKNSLEKKISTIPVLEQDELFNFLLNQLKKFDRKDHTNSYVVSDEDEEDDEEMVSKVLNALLKSNVIKVMKDNLLGLHNS